MLPGVEHQAAVESLPARSYCICLEHQVFDSAPAELSRNGETRRSRTHHNGRYTFELRAPGRRRGLALVHSNKGA